MGKLARGGERTPKRVWPPGNVYCWRTRMHRLPLHGRRVRTLPLFLTSHPKMKC